MNTIKKLSLLFLLISLNIDISYSQTNDYQNSVCLYFNKGTMNFKHSPKQLDSFILKYQVIKVIPISLSYEIFSDKYIDFKRAQTALEYYKKHSKLDRGKFYVLYIEHEVKDKVKMKRYDSEYDNKCFVSFEPMFYNSNMSEIKSDTSKIVNDEEMWFIKD